MAVKVICCYATLMQLASKMGQARLHGTKDEYEAAKKRHDDYHELCLKADGMKL